MNQRPQSAVAAAISRRAHKRRFDAPAQSAQRRAHIFILILRQRIRRKKTLAAKRTHSPPDALHAVETLLADRESRNFNHRPATGAAIGGKENGKKILGNLNRNSARPRGLVRRSNRRPCRCGCGLDSPNSVSTTAEDGLRDPRKNALLRVACSSASITAFGPARQRCDCCRIELREPAASPLLLTAAPSPA